jgi:STE24 endopeptidase
VVWDTNIAKETTPEIISDFGHEMGHYVLGHVWKGLLFTAALFFLCFYLGYRSIGWVLARWGKEWEIRGADDLAALPALLLILSIFNFASDPMSNAFSRHVEHQADVYGLEVTHGVIPDAGQAAADSFQIEGESYLADPDPNALDVFLFYDHPPISDRVRLCLDYDPWSKGEPAQFVH